MKVFFDYVAGWKPEDSYVEKLEDLRAYINQHLWGIAMKIRFVWEHNGDDSIFYLKMVDYLKKALIYKR